MSTRQLAILVIHGMGTQKRGYSESLEKKVLEELPPETASRTAWEEVYWADILAGPQKNYLKAARNSQYQLDFFKFRQFVVSALGDASGYRLTRDPAGSTYSAVHQRVRDSIEALSNRVAPSTPLIVLAHSLGGHIMSNYIWDLQKPGQSKGLGYFCSGRTLGGIVTFGCNLPLFIFAYGKANIVPIDFPGARLPAWAKPHAKWLNFYDPDDVLGYPLKPINQAYKDRVHSDQAIHVGNLFTGWNPLAHTQYWDDRSLTRPISQFLQPFLE